jgi:hypothetical protein
MATPKQITIRAPSHALARRLRALSKARGESLNATILRLLEDATGLSEREAFLATMPRWSDEDAAQLDEVLREQRVIDAKLWR